jgi:integrase
MRMRDIRTAHLEDTIKNADVGDNTKSRMKSLFNQMYKYALKHEIVDKDYAALCDSVKKPKPQIIRIPFSDVEIQKLWDNIDFPFADMLLIGIYTGWRPQELAILHIEDIDFKQMTITGGLKTDVGKNRIVPIHPVILELIQENYNHAKEINSSYLFNDEYGQQGSYMTYDKYRRRFDKVMKRLNMKHRPHDTRHTFITKAKAAGMDEYILKLIVGHSIKDITEKVYTHRTIEDMQREIQKIKN